MSVCPSCKAEGWSAGAPCPRCGAVAVVVRELELELDMPPPPKPKPPAPRKKIEEERIDLAVDLESLRGSPVDMHLGGGAFPDVGARPTSGQSIASSPPVRGYASVAPSARAPIGGASAGSPLARGATRVESDDELEARTLADYGDPPTNILRAPLYAYRVFKRQAELKKALVGRKEEASHALVAAEDAMVSLGERVRPLAASDPACGPTLSALKQSEELLRSRDHSLAREQDAHTERLASMDARAAKLEQELLAAKAEERKAVADHADAVATLQRAEAKLRRADIELRALQAGGKRTRA